MKKTDEYGRQETSGHKRMLQYLEDLTRNKTFRRKMKKLHQAQRKYQSGEYKDWSKKEQEEHARINRELGEIIGGYELLRKRLKRLFKKDKAYLHNKEISELYHLDSSLIWLASALYSGDAEEIRRARSYADPDMCVFMAVADDELNPLNKGEEIIYLNGRRRATITAYPVAIGIHPKATKRDVLDFIEKRWKWVENELRDGKSLKYRKEKKYPQELRDFLWQNRHLPPRKRKEKLDERFRNSLVYHEINAIIRQEKAKREATLT